MEQLESNLELICFQLCAAMFSGCREYRNSGVKVVTGCTSIPAPESKVGAIFEICLVFNKLKFQFCSTHKKENTPCILTENISSKSLNSLRNYRTRSSVHKEALQVIKLFSIHERSVILF